ncbi:tRNA (N6-threonylcarbamoyladenosine(37)-N6)-methyltransferase TrmO [uncultured Pelagimonas sp.]|uniref:tRNA (N6-threonylcarbamoyladenosine(37)-N6)-methyltransferase TrmO n=1 Tax=uncultured Pelagimonas sp. TaxID=1618102 RepID=UPI002624BB6A|nr:tRNA (N6-threonylcarbamoyladenosine(37)-N6)-methyltransferase TrmO [uncultured Pelagimonas sp.]
MNGVTPDPSDAPRPGETVLDASIPEQASLQFIGHLRTPFATRNDCPRQGDPAHGPDCHVVVEPRFEPALQGLEPGTRLELLYWLDRARRDLLTQSPKSNGETRGTFALRSPVRPNPIGTSVVELIARDGATLTVRGLDCLDGTPLLDIKPDRRNYCIQVPPKP